MEISESPTDSFPQSRMQTVSTICPPGCAGLLSKGILTPRELIESCCLSPIMAPAIAPCHSLSSPSVNLPASSDRWLTITPIFQAEIFTFWVSRCRHAGRMLRLFLISIFFCDKKFDCDKNILLFGKMLKMFRKVLIASLVYKSPPTRFCVKDHDIIDSGGEASLPSRWS